MRVLVTGSSSHLAQALLPMLCKLPDIDMITGIDIKAGIFQHPKFHAIQADLRQVELVHLLKQQDAVVHLAFVVLRGKTPVNVMRAVNLDASKRLFETAVELNIPRITYLSSASVYGQGTNLNEEANFNPIPGFLYAEHKTELERWLIQNCPQIIRLRPHIILGKHAQPLLINLLRQPFYVKLPEPQPLLQCIHEDDVARAIIQTLFLPASGAYNLAANIPFSFHDAIQRRHRLSIPISPVIASKILKLTWAATGIGGETGWLDGVHHSLTLDCSKAENDLQWQAQISTRDMLLMR